MTAPCEPRRAPPRRLESPFPRCFVGIILVTLALRLPTSFGRCRAPPVYQSMKLKGTPKASYFPGEKISFECKPGYYYAFHHALDSFCQQNSTWLPVNKACHKKACPTVNVQNGAVYDPQIGFEFGKEAHFYCDYGYYLIGEPILTCKLSGDKVHWSHDIPKCEKILCKAPGKIKNGKFTNSWRGVFEFNEGVTYSCNPSHGPQAYSLVGENRLTCSGPGKWSSDPPECKVVRCRPPELKHGKPVSEMKGTFFYKEEFLFECLEGFYLNSSNPVFCGGNSTWEPEMPACIKGFTSASTKSPFSGYLGYSKLRQITLLDDIVELEPGTIALIIIIIFVGIAVTCTCVYKCLHGGKKG